VLIEHQADHLTVFIFESSHHKRFYTSTQQVVYSAKQLSCRALYRGQPASSMASNKCNAFQIAHMGCAAARVAGRS
jgi:hypothetical protein